jgi:hypothetical protein
MKYVIIALLILVVIGLTSSGLRTFTDDDL